MQSDWSDEHNQGSTAMTMDGHSTEYGRLEAEGHWFNSLVATVSGPLAVVSISLTSLRFTTTLNLLLSLLAWSQMLRYWQPDGNVALGSIGDLTRHLF